MVRGRVVACTAVWALLACALNGLSARASQLSSNAILTGSSGSRSSSTVMQVYNDDDRARPLFSALAVPPNLVLPSSLRDLVESMLQESRTFRRQCVRLMHARELTIFVEYATLLDGSRATTTIVRGRDGRVVARVRLAQSVNREELLAHEFEHIIEQLDGIDLPLLARHSTSGVRMTLDSGHFETDRANAAGRQVVRELQVARGSRE